MAGDWDHLSFSMWGWQSTVRIWATYLAVIRNPIRARHCVLFTSFEMSEIHVNDSSCLKAQTFWKLDCFLLSWGRLRHTPLGPCGWAWIHLVLSGIKIRPTITKSWEMTKNRNCRNQHLMLRWCSNNCNWTEFNLFLPELPAPARDKCQFIIMDFY